MSRTYRRKKDNGYNHFEAYDYVWVDNYLVKKYYSKGSAEYRKEKAKYHSDRSMYGTGVPHEWVNLNCERPLRMKTKKAIHNWIKNPDSELMAPEFIHDAGYTYW